MALVSVLIWGTSGGLVDVATMQCNPRERLLGADDGGVQQGLPISCVFTGNNPS